MIVATLEVLQDNLEFHLWHRDYAINQLPQGIGNSPQSRDRDSASWPLSTKDGT